MSVGEMVYPSHRLVKLILRGSFWKDIEESSYGDALFTMKSVALRELLQNAIDAVRMYSRMKGIPARELPIRILLFCIPIPVLTIPSTVDLATERAVEIKDMYGGSEIVHAHPISEFRNMLIEDNRMIICISDRGIGMDSLDLARYLAGMGTGVKQMSGVRKMRKASGAVLGGFGLGFWSVSLIAEGVIIVSKKEGKEPVIRAVFFKSISGTYGAENIRYFIDENGRVGNFITLDLDTLRMMIKTPAILNEVNEVIRSHGTVVIIIVRDDLESLEEFNRIRWEALAWLYFIRRKTGDSNIDVRVDLISDMHLIGEKRAISSDELPDPFSMAICKTSFTTKVVNKAPFAGEALVDANVEIYLLKGRNDPYRIIKREMTGKQAIGGLNVYIVLNDLLVSVTEGYLYGLLDGAVIVRIISPGVPATIGRSTIDEDLQSEIDRHVYLLLFRPMKEDFFTKPAEKIKPFTMYLRKFRSNCPSEYVDYLLELMNDKRIMDIELPDASGRVYGLKVLGLKNWTYIDPDKYLANKTYYSTLVKVITAERADAIIFSDADICFLLVEMEKTYKEFRKSIEESMLKFFDRIFNNKVSIETLYSEVKRRKSGWTPVPVEQLLSTVTGEILWNSIISPIALAVEKAVPRVIFDFIGIDRSPRIRVAKHPDVSVIAFYSLAEDIVFLNLNSIFFSKEVIPYFFQPEVAIAKIVDVVAHEIAHQITKEYQHAHGISFFEFKQALVRAIMSKVPETTERAFVDITNIDYEKMREHMRNILDAIIEVYPYCKNIEDPGVAKDMLVGMGRTLKKKYDFHIGNTPLAYFILIIKRRMVESEEGLLESTYRMAFALLTPNMPYVDLIIRFIEAPVSSRGKKEYIHKMILIPNYIEMNGHPPLVVVRPVNIDGMFICKGKDKWSKKLAFKKEDIRHIMELLFSIFHDKDAPAKVKCSFGYTTGFSLIISIPKLLEDIDYRYAYLIWDTLYTRRPIKEPEFFVLVFPCYAFGFGKIIEYV